MIGRADMVKSIDVMIANSQLASIPGGSEAASTLRGVQVVAKAGTGSLSAAEYELMANQYAAAREDLRRAFQAMSAGAQAEGKAFVRGLRAKDEARMQEMNDEEERLRRVRAKIQAEAAASAAAREAGPPRKKKTLAELEAEQSAFGKQKQPVLSLYAR